VFADRIRQFSSFLPFVFLPVVATATMSELPSTSGNIEINGILEE